MTWTVFLLLGLFGIKHFIADFVLQTPYMVREKGTYGARGGIYHAIIHAMFTFGILVVMAPSINYSIILAVLDGVIHYHIDWGKQQLTKNYTSIDQMFWIYFGLDQTLHYLTYIGIIAIITL